MSAIVISIVIGLIVNECCDVSPWCARRLVRWSAARRYADPDRAAARAEELAALVDARPGKLLKLFTALGFAGSAILVACRRSLAQWLDPNDEKLAVPASPAVTLEPVLVDADYEAVLATFSKARNAFASIPSLTAKLREQDIQDILLTLLNSQFEDRAGDNPFNDGSKADILLMQDDRVIFIAECKVYDQSRYQSAQYVVGIALEKLLGRLAWRDTKAALLLFIREPADVRQVVDEAVVAIRSHPRHIGDGRVSNEDRHDFIFQAEGGANRQIFLALLPFVISKDDDIE